MITDRLLSALRSPRISATLRATADWIDLEWSTLNELLVYAAPNATGRLLDVGCGDKPHEPIFQPYVDAYVGVEYDATFAATQASRRKRKADVLYDGKRLPFDDGSFDTVLSVQVLEHTPQPFELFAEMARVLRKDGVLILTVPFSGRLHEEPHDYLRFTPHMLRLLCEQNGLRVKELRARGGFWSVVGHKLNSYLGFRVLRMDALAQAMGKLGQEAPAEESTAPRWWTLPFVAPAMLTVASSARILDKRLPDATEMLGFLLIAEKDGR
jgi:SAM-dependent methyltransferase